MMAFSSAPSHLPAFLTLFFLFFFHAALTSASASSSSPPPSLPPPKVPKVTIKNGTLLGAFDPVNRVRKFLGVPFAEPPVGALRLRQAVPVRRAWGEREARGFGKACYGSGQVEVGEEGEDCLTVNIWRGEGDEEEGEGEGGLPVLVWLYGGGLTAGYTVSRMV